MGSRYVGPGELHTDVDPAATANCSSRSFEELVVDVAWNIGVNFMLKGGVSSKEYDLCDDRVPVLERHDPRILQANVTAQASTVLSSRAA